MEDYPAAHSMNYCQTSDDQKIKTIDYIIIHSLL
jgi:hypothetical protein